MNANDLKALVVDHEFNSVVSDTYPKPFVESRNKLFAAIDTLVAERDDLRSAFDGAKVIILAMEKERDVLTADLRAYKLSLQAIQTEIGQLVAERDKLLDDATNLKSTMMAGAVEITTYWDAHCDAEGYGPSSLVRRLENGYPAQYGYDAESYVRLEKERDALKAQDDTATGFWLSDEFINSIVIDSLTRLIARAKGAHMADVDLRINGKNEYYQADWIKYMVRVKGKQDDTFAAGAEKEQK